MPKIQRSYAYVQKNEYRNFYNTSQLIDNMLNGDYLSDKEILENQGAIVPSFANLSKKDTINEQI